MTNLEELKNLLKTQIDTWTVEQTVDVICRNPDRCLFCVNNSKTCNKNIISCVDGIKTMLNKEVISDVKC